MYDTRIDILATNPVAVSTDTTTTGETLDLLDGYTGDYKEGAPVGYGIGVKLLFVPTTATGTDITAAVKWQVSDDGSTWVDDQVILDATNIIDVTVDADIVGTKYEVESRLRTPRRYARVVITTTSTSSGAFNVYAWAADGTTMHGFSTQPHI